MIWENPNFYIMFFSIIAGGLLVFAFSPDIIVVGKYNLLRKKDRGRFIRDARRMFRRRGHRA